MNDKEADNLPTIVFGAFDRHNLGDLLFPHIVAAMLERDGLIFAGLVGRDLRNVGGHQVRALSSLATEYRERAVNFVHAGGELLTCDAWEAAVMLLPPEEAQAAILSLSSREQDRLAWARSMIGIASLAPYVTSRELFPNAKCVAYNAVGGMDLEERAPALRAEVLASLRQGDVVFVRDKRTQSQLDAHGIVAGLLPDCAVMVKSLFDERIQGHAQSGEVLQLRQAFPHGYIAVQFSGGFGDDRTLDTIASQLDQVTRSTGYGIALFRAGAAPWHDDLSLFRRITARMPSPAVTVFTSLDIWDICALIASSRAYAGSSLHGRIVAMAYALPRINLHEPGYVDGVTKQAAFAHTWEPPGMPVAVTVTDLAAGLYTAMASDRGWRERVATQLVDACRSGFARVRACVE